MVEATVLEAKPFGVFVETHGVQGFVPVPELSWGRVGNPELLFKKGQALRCKVLKLPDASRPNEFVGSVRAVHPEQNPWRDPEIYKEGTVYRGRVVLQMPYGCFVEHPRGACGLLHVDDLDRSIALGDELEVVVVELEVDKEKFRVHVVDDIATD